VEYPQIQIEELKAYCSGISILNEAGVSFLCLEELTLPSGCTPAKCNALLCPVGRDGYPSRLYFSEMIKSSYPRNWNVSNARIGEENWFAFSWRVKLSNPTLAQVLVEHLKGFTRSQ
jgi:hypothetical protein